MRPATKKQMTYLKRYSKTQKETSISSLYCIHLYLKAPRRLDPWFTTNLYRNELWRCNLITFPWANQCALESPTYQPQKMIVRCYFSFITTYQKEHHQIGKWTTLTEKSRGSKLSVPAVCLDAMFPIYKPPVLG
jgi:hypothetical protein